MSDFYQGQPVLVTGAGGFIGSHLVEMLVSAGARVRAFVRYNSRGDPGLLALLPAQVSERVEIIPGDLCDLPAVLAASQEAATIFHLGALISIPYSYVHPAEVVQTNVLGTMNVLLAARQNGVKRVVHTSTSEVYGTARHVPMDESHPLQGQSPYSASKIGADKLAESFYCAYGLPVVTVRPFNTYGPRQSTRAVIPTIITQALTQDVIFLGNLEAARDLTYVGDTARGFLLAGEIAGIEGEVFNLGTGQEIQIGALAHSIIDLVGRPVSIQVDPSRLRPEKSEVQRLLSNNQHAQARLGWSPQVNLLQGLRQTIEWFSIHLPLQQPQEYQI
jgi:dTDP-glucose 4,6-dehydratase